MKPEAAIRALTKVFQVTGYASGNENEILRAAAEQVVELLEADLCVFISCSEDGRTELAAANSRTMQAEASALVGMCISNCKVLDECIAFWSDSAPPACCEHNIISLCPGAHLCVPMISRERPLGVLSVAYQADHVFTKAEIDVYLAIAGAVTAAVENARLYRKVEDHVNELEHQVRERTRELLTLYDSTRALIPTVSVAKTMKTIAEQLALATSSDSAILVNFSKDAPQISTLYGTADIAHIEPYASDLVELSRLPWTEPICILTLDGVSLIPLEAIQGCLGRQLLAVPLIYKDSLMALVMLGRLNEAEPYGAGELRIAGALANQAAMAVAVSQEYEHDRIIAEAFQKSLLPPPLCQVGKFHVAGIYQPASSEANVGGDLYDIWQADDDRLILLIGDISGKGLKAALSAATLKYSLRAYSELGDGPATVVARANQALYRWSDEALFATLFYAELNTRNGEMRYVNAGHEPPTVVNRIPGVSLPLNISGPAVGIISEAQYSEFSVTLRDDDILVMVTDGISEANRSSDILDYNDIGRIVREANINTASGIASHLYDSAISISGGSLYDDAAVVVVIADSSK